MKRVASRAPHVALLLSFALLSSAFSQQGRTTQGTQAQTPPASQTSQAAPSPAQQNEEDEVVRITSNLVQFDVTVRDKSGRIVTDLKPEDFEVIVDGRPQPITALSYVSVSAGTLRKERAGKRAVEKDAPPAPPVQLRPEQVRRAIALVVDDLGTSFESIYFVREGLKKFVNEQMQPGDLVAIMRTSAGMGALQQFTSDKRLLLRAIERVRWTPRGRAGVSAFAAIESDPRDMLPGPKPNSEFGSASRDNSGRNSNRRGGDEIDEFREDIFAVGTLGALNFIIKGLKEIPGRKSVIMFSDGFSIYNRDQDSSRIRESLRRLVDLATRSSVVISTVDARGLATLGLTAADNTSGMDTMQIEQAMFDRRGGYFNTQAGLSYLAEATGGNFIRNNNDMGDAARRVLESQSDYYIVAFRPDELLFDQTRGRVRYNSVKVKVNRPGLQVRTRGGFYGFTESEAQPVRRTRRDQLLGALTSPFSTGDVPVRLTSFFASAQHDKSFVTSLLHIDVSGFRFEEEADGWRKAVLDVVALTFGENGQIIDEVNRTETIRARAEAYSEMLKHGLVFATQVPVKKPGVYQLRIAVRDAASEKLGSASQLIEVPDLKKERLALSGIVLTGVEAAGITNAADGKEIVGDPMGGPAVRRFRQGAVFEYYYDIYNARIDKATGRPRLTTQTRVFRDGQAVFTGDVRPFDPGQQEDMRKLRGGGRLKLIPDFKPGEYQLQVVITDETAKEKQRVVTQWIDFEIVD